MTDTREMLDASPVALPIDVGRVAAAIDACLSCFQCCLTDADADLAEDDVDELRACIALCLDCAEICDATARALSRPAHWDLALVKGLLQACVRVCTACAEECAKHADRHRHCAICEKTCRECIEACTALLEAAAFTSA